MDTRIVGILLPALTVGFAGRDLGASRRTERERGAAASLGAFAAAWVGLTVLLWPTLWRNPLANFVHVFEGMRNFPWEATVLYLGKEIWSTGLPWHYTLVWIGVSTPLVYLAAFAVGLGGGGLR